MRGDNPFYWWLLEQKERKNDIGELARYVAKDKDFPRRADAPTMEIYLSKRLASMKIRRAFLNARKEYRTCQRKRGKLATFFGGTREGQTG